MDSNKLKEIIEDFNNLRQSYRNKINNKDLSKDTLLEYQGRFTDLKADIRPFHAEVMKGWIRRDDKSATAIKFRLALAIHEGEYEGIDACSINQAEKHASGTPQYKEFIDERAFWKESLTNINDLRDDLSSYIIEISNRLKA